jgi:hypothetical protein
LFVIQPFFPHFGLLKPYFQIPAAPFIQPVLPGRENLNATTYSYLISNKEKNKKVLFDLGPRKDLENLSPAARALLSQFEFNAAKDITELLHEAETPLDAINAVMFRSVDLRSVVAHFLIGDLAMFMLIMLVICPYFHLRLNLSLVLGPSVMFTTRFPIPTVLY